MAPKKVCVTESLSLYVISVLQICAPDLLPAGMQWGRSGIACRAVCSGPSPRAPVSVCFCTVIHSYPLVVLPSWLECLDKLSLHPSGVWCQNGPLGPLASTRRPRLSKYTPTGQYCTGPAVQGENDELQRLCHSRPTAPKWLRSSSCNHRTAAITVLNRKKTGQVWWSFAWFYVDFSVT